MLHALRLFLTSKLIGCYNWRSIWFDILVDVFFKTKQTTRIGPDMNLIVLAFTFVAIGTLRTYQFMIFTYTHGTPLCDFKITTEF